MEYKRVLTIQDVSCFGQCSTTVALPIISAMGIECAIMPTAILSTHTAGFTGFTVRDLSEDLRGIFNHWNKEKIFFDAIYTGYLGAIDEIDAIIEYYDGLENKPLLIVDPAMGDNGKLYPAFNEAYVAAMRRLCQIADYLIPNETERDFLFGKDGNQMQLKAGASLVLTGYCKREGYTGALVKGKDSEYYYEHPKLAVSRHGTGDIYSSVFTGALLKGKTANEAAKIACDFTYECIKNSLEDESHKYGVKFELELPKLLERFK